MKPKQLVRKVIPAPTIGSKLKKLSHKVVARPERPRREFSIEVIIPCYNHADFLPEAIESLSKQTWSGPLSITFINDHSTDGTAKIISGFAEKNRHDFIIKILNNQTNLRQWASINRAVSESINDLIVILNDDDMLTADSIEKIATAFTNNPDIYMVGGSSLWIEGNGAPKHTIVNYDSLKLTVTQPADTWQFKLLNDLNMTHSSCSFFKVAWQTVGGYMPKNRRLLPEMNEDRDFQMRVNALFPVGVFKDYPLAYWRSDTSHGKQF